MFIFCENARSTLPPIAAFKKSNTHFRVTDNFDTIDLVNSSGKVLIRSSFDPQTNVWPICKPLRAEQFLSQSTPYCNKLVSPLVEMNSIFKSPNAIESSQFTWNPADMTKDEKTLLFGHASLRQIRRLVKLKLGYGLPDTMPSGTIKCPVCSICKATRTLSLGPTNRSSEALSVVVIDLMGPFDPPHNDWR
jgi:hypothetical protein